MKTIDLTLLKEVLEDVNEVVGVLDGTQIDDNTLGNKPKEAQLNRELLNLADQLTFAAALVRNEYWTGKGLLSYDPS